MKKYKHVYLAVALSGLLAHPASAQWTPLAPLVTSTNDTASVVSMVRGFDSRLFACTDKGLFMSYDNGDNWTDLTYTKAVVAGKPITSFYYDEHEDRLYAGGENAVYASSDNGVTWPLTAITSIVRANDIGKIGFNIIVSYGIPGSPSGGVYYSDDNLATYKSATIPGLPKFGLLTDGPYAYAAGTDGAFITTDMGATWSLSGTGHPSGARYYRLLRQNSNIFAGDINGHGLVKSPDGSLWTNVNPAVFSGFCQVYDIVANPDIIIAAVNGACNTDGPLKASQDGGASWHSLMDGLPLGIYNRLGKNNAGDCFYTFNTDEKRLYRNCSAVGIKDNTLDAAAIAITPNPATDDITISGTRTANVRIYDVQGRSLYEHQFNNELIRIPVRNFVNGVYFVTLQQQQQRITKTIVKQ